MAMQMLAPSQAVPVQLVGVVDAWPRAWPAVATPGAWPSQCLLPCPATAPSWGAPPAAAPLQAPVAPSAPPPAPAAPQHKVARRRAGRPGRAAAGGAGEDPGCAAAPPSAGAGAAAGAADRAAEAEETEWEALQEQAARRIHDCTRLINGASPESIGRIMQDELAANMRLEWEEVEWAYDGQQDMCGLYSKLKTAVPDLRVQVQRIEMEADFNVRICLHFSGTQAEPIVPMFPVGERFNLFLISTTGFDRSLRLQSDSLHISFEGTLGWQPSIFQWLLESADELASKEGGCRMLQRAVDAGQDRERLALAERFRGRVWDASASHTANFVLQKCVIGLPPSALGFVVEAFQGRAAEAAAHPIQSRMIERLLEYFPAEELDGIIGELTSQASALSRNRFGNFALQRVLEHGTAAQRRALIEALRQDAAELAQHYAASNVLRSALIHGSPGDQYVLIGALTADPVVARGLEKHRTASFVMREVKALRRSAAMAEAAGSGLQRVSL